MTMEELQQTAEVLQRELSEDSSTEEQNQLLTESSGDGVDHGAGDLNQESHILGDDDDPFVDTPKHRKPSNPLLNSHSRRLGS